MVKWVLKSFFLHILGERNKEHWGNHSAPKCPLHMSPGNQGSLAPSIGASWVHGCCVSSVVTLCLERRSSAALSTTPVLQVQVLWCELQQTHGERSEVCYFNSWDWSKEVCYRHISQAEVTVCMCLTHAELVRQSDECLCCLRGQLSHKSDALVFFSW